MPTPLPTAPPGSPDWMRWYFNNMQEAGGGGGSGAVSTAATVSTKLQR